MTAENIAKDDIKDIMNTPDQFRHCAALTQLWIDYIAEHADVMLGTQLRSAGIVAGLAMRMCDVGDDNVEEAASQMAQVSVMVYHDSVDAIQPATIQ